MSSEQPDAKAASAHATDQAATATTAPSIDEQLELAKRAFALKKYEQAVDHYATALEQMTAKHGDNAPEIADVYFAYGKALLENAIAQSSVLGKEQTDEALGAEEEASGSGAFLSFSGDPEDDEPVDLFGQSAKEEEEDEDEEDGEGEGDDGEPEDDFNAAWEVLDLARALFEKRQDESDEIKLKLADTYICLGDVSLETEKFDQAITDYETGLGLKIELLPQSSREIAEAHYKLSIVLDMSSGRLSDAIDHAEKALASVEARLAELRNAASGQMKVETLQQPDPKGKGKGPAGPRLLGDNAIQNMTQSQITSEIKELEGLREDLALKVEELKTLPNEQGLSAPALAAKALDNELNAAAPAAPAAPAPVNDLTSMVKKKKKPAVQTSEEAATSASTAGASDANGSAKRKAEDEPSASPSEKKARLAETDAPAS